MPSVLDVVWNTEDATLVPESTEDSRSVAPQQVDVAVVGAGPIGLAVAWRLQRAGLRVRVFDGEEPHAAWRVSAGMLAPATELDYGHGELALWARAALEGYPEFVAELEAASGRTTGFRRVGSLSLAFDRDQLEALRRRHLLLSEELGLEVAWLRASECREREPLLSPRVAGAIHAPADARVDPRALRSALHQAVIRAGGSVEAGRVEALVSAAGRTVGVRSGGEHVEATTVVLAAGIWTAKLFVDARLPLRPVKGQILRLAARTRPTHLLLSDEVYLFGRESGEVVLGATAEERGFDAEPTAGGVYRLLEEARRMVPGVDEWALSEVGVGFRPSAPDHAPLLGELAPGLVAACGHHRNGILLAAVTAEAIAHLLERGELPPAAAPFTLERFRDESDRDQPQGQAVRPEES